MKNNKNNKRKMAVAVLAGLALTGLVGASAASLGGIRGGTLGADAEDVISCDTDGVDVVVQHLVQVRRGCSRPDAADGINGHFNVDSVTLSDVNVDCVGKAYRDPAARRGQRRHRQPLQQHSRSSRPRRSLRLHCPGRSRPSPSDGVDAETVYGIAITISG